MEKQILDACCGGKMFYYDKADKRVLFQDIIKLNSNMEREILFRGKSIDTGKWLYGHLFNYGLTAPTNVPCICVCVPTSWKEAYNIYTVHPDTIGQYTGLKDKNGKKIFEGDIVEFTNLDLPDMVIRFDNGSFMFCEDENSTYEELRMTYTVEVVGHIYDTPELMK